MALKEYFQDNSVAEIKRKELIRFQTKRNLDNRIEDLDANQAGIIAVRMIPQEFMRMVETEEQGALQWTKWGSYFPISQPLTVNQALNSSEIPLSLRIQAIAALQKAYPRIEECPALGLSNMGITERDKIIRNISFVNTGKAHRLFSYAHSIDEPIIQEVYSTNAKSGASILGSIPSRRKGVADYKLSLSKIPLSNGTEKRALVWNFGGSFRGQQPMNLVARVRLRQDSPETMDISPQMMVAYFAYIENQLSQHNFTPLEMNPLVLFSRKQAEFAVKLNNQVLVQDISQKGKLRKLYEAEQSWLLMQRALRNGHNSTLYWDPLRDGSMSNYNLRR